MKWHWLKHTYGNWKMYWFTNSQGIEEVWENKCCIYCGKIKERFMFYDSSKGLRKGDITK